MSRPPDAAPCFDAAFRGQLEALLRWRRDVRRFRTDPLPDDALDRLLRLACLAPSVGLSEPWRFVSVERAERRQAVRDLFARSNADALSATAPADSRLYAGLKLAGLDRAPCQLALFVEPEPEQGRGLGRRTMPETVAYSAAMALHTLWLAARAEGIGLGWVSILDPAAMAGLLEVPPHWRFVAYACLGWPEAEAATPELERAGWEHRRQGPPPLLLR